MVENGYSYDNRDIGKSFKRMCSNVVGCKVQPLTDVCQPLFERLGLGVRPEDWGLKPPFAGRKSWQELRRPQLEAASSLGWSQESWSPWTDEDMKANRNSAPEEIKNLPWHSLELTTRNLLRTLGYHEGNWDGAGGVDFGITALLDNTDIFEHFRFWVAVDRVWPYQLPRQVDADSTSRLTGETECENKGLSQFDCENKGCCQYDSQNKQCWSSVGTGQCGSFEKKISIQNRILKRGMVIPGRETEFGIHPVTQANSSFLQCVLSQLHPLNIFKETHLCSRVYAI